MPRGDEMARGHLVAWSHNASGNIMGRVNTNPLLKTRLYQVEFVGGGDIELTANIIAESIYTPMQF